MSIQQQLDLCLRILVAAILSAVIGYDRERKAHSAGLRTHLLIGIGSAMFTGLSALAFVGGDPGRIAAQIVVGVGFLGAGAILQTRGSRRIHGMTTAADMWVVAAIGMACGTGNYVVAVVVTALVLITLTVVKRVEGRKPPDDQGSDEENSAPAGPPHSYSSMRLRDRRPPGSS